MGLKSAAMGMALSLLALVDIGHAEPPPLSDSEAMATIGTLYNSVPNGGVQVGRISLVRDGFNGPGRTATQREFEWIKAWAAVGFVTIAEDPSYQAFNSGQSFSWGQLLQSTTAGVLTVIDVEPTERGLSVGTVDTGFLRFRPETTTIDEVVRSEYVRHGVDDYQVVWFIFTNTPKDFFLEYLKALGHEPGNPKGKGRALFK